MGSNYCGEQNQSSSSSRKGKKNGSDKPKQPQRGLGVAQLEKIRLHSQMSRGFISPNPLQTPYPVTNYPIQEDVRMHTAAYQSSSSFSYPTASSTSYGFHGAQNMMMGLGDLERANIRYGESQNTTANIARWNGGNTVFESQHYQQPSMTRHLLNLESEEFMEKKKVRNSDSMGSGSQNSGSSGSQEIDLELRLSL
ncbi:protein SPEAR1-like [Apium graveolens]|uniref:protein SPEAR1-like n=1 Tax=Apium graveolens TaxID=4045 RepID=UPI003D7BB8FA